MNYSKFKTESLDGQWPDILMRLGVDPAYLRNVHGPCPGCGGKDRFRFDDKNGRGTFICGGAGDIQAGDGFTLLEQTYGWTFKEALRHIACDFNELNILKNNWEAPVKPVSTVSPTLGYADQIWARVNHDDDYVAEHPYAVRKGIYWAAGARRGVASGFLIGSCADCILVPMRSLEGEFRGVECINPEGVKQAFGNKGVLILGNDLDGRLLQLVVEGWATAARTLHIFDGSIAVYTCFGMGKMKQTAAELEGKYPDREVLILEEKDA